LSPDDQSVLDGLKAEYDGLNEEYAAWEDDLPETVDQRLGELETAIEALEGTVAESFDAADTGRAGAVVSIDRDGSPLILRGFVRREDEASTPVDAAGAQMTNDGEGQAERPTPIINLAAAATSPVQPEDDEAEIWRPLPEKLILELTAFRTIALREAVARNPRVAMALLLHKLVSDTFRLPRGGSCLQVWVSPPQLFNIAQKTSMRPIRPLRWPADASFGPTSSRTTTRPFGIGWRRKAMRSGPNSWLSASAMV
jgi:ParB family chromosome partitioning protein